MVLREENLRSVWPYEGEKKPLWDGAEVSRNVLPTAGTVPFYLTSLQQGMHLVIVSRIAVVLCTAVGHPLGSEQLFEIRAIPPLLVLWCSFLLDFSEAQIPGTFSTCWHSSSVETVMASKSGLADCRYVNFQHVSTCMQFHHVRTVLCAVAPRMEIRQQDFWSRTLPLTTVTDSASCSPPLALMISTHVVSAGVHLLSLHGAPRLPRPVR